MAFGLPAICDTASTNASRSAQATQNYKYCGCTIIGCYMITVTRCGCTIIDCYMITEPRTMAPTHARLALLCVVAFAWTPSHTAASLGNIWEHVTMAPTHARLALMCVVAFAWTPSHTATSLGSMWERVWHPLDGPSVSASASTSRRLSATAPGNPGVEVKYVHGETVPKFSISVGDTSCPKNLDWRDLGAVTPVRDQGECAASWAFAAISAVESAHFIATKELVSMSVQQLIDCDTANTGCAGGDPALALDYLMQKTPGVVHEAEYPFMTEAAVCRVDTTHRVAEIVSNVEYLPMNEGDLKSAVCNQPVVIFMGVDPALTGFSGGGIFEASAPKECGETISHAVLLVGYGTTDDGEEYWLAKSSWRGEMANIADWGDGGFFKFPRGVGFCGMLAVNPVIPIVASSVSFTTALEECPIVDHTVEAGDTPHR
eukprot:gene7057-153_t